MDHHFAAEIQRRTAGQHHRDENHHVSAEENLCETDAGFAPDPRNRHHRLPDVVVLFTALSRLVLLTPRANLLAKRQPRKPPPTSNAVRHRTNKRLSV